MKKLALTFLAMVFFGITLFAQAPEAFKYQAVIKNTDGEIISGQEVSIKISILNENPTGDVVYSEEHSVTTNDIGMVSLSIGKGSLLIGDFSQIPWNEGDKFLKIEIDDSGGSSYAELGTFQLLSVPYALFASSASKLGNNVEYSSSPDTLFVVKDHEGNAVFVVYPDGAEVITNNNLKGRLGGFAVSGRTSTKGENSEYLVVTPDSTRIYVNEPLQKGRLGGFAVSGRTSTKGLVNDYLFVTGDSTRIYVNEDESKGRLGGFAVSGRTSTKGPYYDYLQVTKDSTRVYILESETKGRLGGFAVSGRTSTKEMANDYFNVSGNLSAEIVNNESRIMWYPQKAALLAGEIHVGGADSVGTNSMAMGYRSISMGNFSQAFGYKAQAIGDYATAIGDSAIANGLSSFALGDQSISNSKGSYSFGYNAQALGDGCFALGSVGVDTSGFYNDVLTIADGVHSFAIGQGAQTNSGIGNIALGSHAIAQGGVHSISIGSDGVYSGDTYPMPIITQNIASGDMSMALGFGNKSNASSSMAIGIANTSNGYRSIAMGYNSFTEANYSFACGYKVLSQALGSFVIGRWNEATGDPENWVDTDPLFVIGNGSKLGPIVMRSNALTVLKNGNVGIGTSSPSTKLSIVGLTGTTSGSYLRIYNNNIYYYSSSRNTKTNIQPLKDNFNKILLAQPVSFTDKLSGEENIGFIAEDFDELGLNNLVIYENDKPKSLSYELVSIYNLEIIKEQQTKIKRQEKKISDLEQRLLKLEQRLQDR